MDLVARLTARLPTRLATKAPRATLTSRLLQTVARRRLAAIAAVQTETALQITYPLPKPSVLQLKTRDLLSGSLGPGHPQRVKLEKGVIDRVSRHCEAYRGEGGFAILRDDEDDLNDQDGSSGRNKHEQGANSARHGLLRGAGADELAHQQR